MPESLKKTRIRALDLLRGTLIVLMALDHANFHIARQHSSGEYWGGAFPVFSSPLHFLTRFVTHICAPGFFFTLGVGMVLFADSRRKKNWKESEIRRHFLVRGLVLIAFQLLLNYCQIWSTQGSSMPFWYGGVLAALGTGLILAIPLLRLKTPWLVMVAGGLFLFMEILTPDPAMWGLNFDRLAGVVLVFGGGSVDLWVNYPLLAWLEVVVFGLFFGRLLLRNEKRAYRIGGLLGGLFLGAFALVRSLNGFGNIRPLPLHNWIGFLSVVKYPPSIAFNLLTVGIDLILLWIYSFIPPEKIGDKNPIRVFGRTALFSYVAHIGIYIMIREILTQSGTGLGVMYMLWLVGLGILYFPAYWYGVYKSKQSSRSWIRFF